MPKSFPSQNISQQTVQENNQTYQVEVVILI